MQSCQSPVNSASGKKSGVQISLNGLFGETYGFDEAIHTSLQSPVHNNLSNGKTNSVSPSKSLSIELNYNQQPVLLSELADGNSFCNIGGSGVLLQGSTLCAYISPYDNSRCTNMASSKSDANESFCTKHLKLPLETKLSHEKPTPTKLKKSVSKPFQLPVISPKKTSTSYGFMVNGSLSPAVNSGSPTTNGIDVGDGQTAAPFTRSGNSNIIFPVSCVTANNNRLTGAKLKGNNKNIYKTVPVVASKQNHTQTRQTYVQTKQETHHAGVNNTLVPMDHDVLQAFVDFLNQNHDKLTPKQQLNLLSSLGVAVATVKNPDDYSSFVNQQQPKSSMANHSLNGPGISAALPTDKCHHSAPKAQKRKLQSSKDTGGSSKKKKKTNSFLSNDALQVSFSQELHEKVLDGSASTDTASKPKRSSKKSVKSIKAKQDLKSSTPMKLETTKPSSLPTVSIPMNRNKNKVLFKKDVSSLSLKSYITKKVDNEIQNENLFSLGPFCDDTDVLVCTCKSNKQVVSHFPKTKFKQISWSQLDQKPCLQCTSINTEHPLNNFFQTTFDSTSDLLRENHAFAQTPTGTLDISADDKTSVKRFCDCSSSDQSLPTRCRYLTKSAKLWKKLQKAENESIKLLAKAAMDNTGDCVMVIKSCGHQNPTCLQRRERDGCMPAKCSLEDRTGNKCPNATLPYSFFCRHHIMHSNNQQLFKLGPNMNVVADVDPDPPPVKQRKRPKLPVLTKRKKRKPKKQNKESDSAKSSQNETTKLLDIKASSNTKTVSKPKGIFHHVSQSVISDYVVENNDEILTSKAVQMPRIIDVPPLSPKTNLLNDCMPANIDEDSSSAIFEAFNFDGADILHDVNPDMFSDLGLDNAFLLNDDPGDSIEKLSFDGINESDSIFSSQTSEGNSSIPDKERKASVKDEQTLLETVSVNATALKCVESSQSDWPPKLEKNSEGTCYIPNNTNTGTEDGNVSLDTSFAEDLNEIEGVIQSLQNETLKPTVADFRKNWSVDDYKNSLKRDASMSIQQQQATTIATVKVSEANVLNQQHQTSSTLKTNVSVTPTMHSSNSIVYPQTQNATKNNRFTTTGLVFAPSQHNAVFLKTDCRKMVDTIKSVRTKSSKRTKTKSSPKKRADVFTICRNGLSQNPTKLQVPTSLANRVNLSTKPVTINSTVTKVFPEKGKDGKKAKPIVAYPTLNSNNATKQTHPTRVQPKLISAATTAKTNSQSMILIPINAVVQSPNQSQPTNQNLGIAFAIPAQSIGSNNSSNLVQIRGSTFLTTSNNQQVLFLGTTPTNNVQLSTSVSISPTMYQSSSTISQTKQAAVVTNSIPISTFNNSNQTGKICVMQNGISTPSSQPTCSIAATTVASTVSTSKISVVKQQPFKKQFSKHSIVIPPVLSNKQVKKLGDSLKIPASTTTTNPALAKPLHKHSFDLSSFTITSDKTVTKTLPPTPQKKFSDSAGGQTSSMLYCRRINPALNPNHPVVVGKLGSLARMNISQPSCTSKGTFQATNSGITKQNLDSSTLKEKNLWLRKNTTSSCASWSSSQTGSTITKPASASPVSTDTGTAQLRDLSNQLLPVTSEASRDSLSSVTSAPCDVISRHGSRKSEHSQMLKDPDFSDSSATVNSAKDLTNITSHTSSSKCSVGVKPIVINVDDTISSLSECAPVSKDVVNASAGTKVCRRAAILRKR